jgi:hypothetical protein
MRYISFVAARSTMRAYIVHGAGIGVFIYIGLWDLI